MAECEEKTRLTIEYQESTQKFSGTVNELQEKMGRAPKAEYKRLQRASEENRIRSEQTRLALEQHIVAHRC